ncbi:MAG: enoyl-CoA hydratase [Bosea sp. (in: a-proteobacteria)]
MSDGIPHIRYHAEGGVAHVTLVQPARMNAMTLAMWTEMPTVLARADADADVRLIVLSGDGDKAFCAGADISEFGAVRTGAAAVAAYSTAVAGANSALVCARKPTVALIRGICFGGGFGLAMCCDLRLASDDSRFRIPAARLGLGYEADSIANLVARIGMAGVADLLLSARVLAKADALRYGIVNLSWPREDFAQEASDYVRAMASNAPLTMQAVKRTLRELARPDRDRDMAAAEAMVGLCFASDDYKEGQRAFAEKRAPIFRGR